MLKIDSYSLKGEKLSPVTLPKDYEGKENLNLLAQAVRVYEAGAHPGLASTKTRAEVNRTKHKLYSQKGTGGARHGAKSAPIFVGGGIAHGPRPVKRILSLPEKMRKRALETAVSLKAKSNAAICVKGLSELKKTKETNALIKKLTQELKAKRFTFIVKEKDAAAIQALKNLRTSSVETFSDLNAYKVFVGGTLVFDEKIFGVEKPARKVQKEPVAKKVAAKKKGSKK